MENGPPVRAASRWLVYTDFSNRLFSGNEKIAKFGDYT